MTVGHPDTVNSKPVSFADITTMRIGGRIGKFIQPASRAEFILSLVDADSDFSTVAKMYESWSKITIE